MGVSFNQLFNDVVSKTNRPELVSETNLAIRNALQFVHLVDFWMRDAQEQLFPFAIPNYVFQMDVTTYFPRFRKIRFIKKYDAATGTIIDNPENEMKAVDPAYLFDRYGCQKTNVFYLAGDSLNIRSSSQDGGYVISWYTYPQITPETMHSWIADMYSAIIVEKAAAEVFRDIGMTDDANRMEKYVLEEMIPILRRNDVIAQA
jgi:hypothetical protein